MHGAILLHRAAIVKGLLQGIAHGAGRTKPASPSSRATAAGAQVLGPSAAGLQTAIRSA